MGVLRLATHAMGTRFEVVLGGPRPERLRPAGEAAIAEIEEWHDRLSLFDPGSFVSHVNTHAAHRPVPLDDEMLELLLECEAIRRASDGAFDIAVAPLMRAWGFHDEAGERDEIPAAGGDAVVIDTARRTIRFRRPGVAIDLGGVGKGHALDRAADELR
ncbi:MAG: FAD:protein FMN transferase, partial [Planctomycetota bacterium]